MGCMVTIIVVAVGVLVFSCAAPAGLTPAPALKPNQYVQPDVLVPDEFTFSQEFEPIFLTAAGGFRFARYGYEAKGHYGKDRIAQWFGEKLPASGWVFVAAVPANGTVAWSARYKKGENETLTLTYSERAQTPDNPPRCILQVAIGK